MAIEIVDCSSGMLEPGKYTFTISQIPEKGAWNQNANYYNFHFIAKANGEIKEHQEKIPVWLAASLLRAIGATEIKPNVFKWDKEESIGHQFDGEIVLEMDKKTGKEYRKLRNIMTIAGFPKDQNIKNDVITDEDAPPF